MLCDSEAKEAAICRMQVNCIAFVSAEWQVNVEVIVRFGRTQFISSNSPGTSFISDDSDVYVVFCQFFTSSVSICLSVCWAFVRLLFTFNVNARTKIGFCRVNPEPPFKLHYNGVNKSTMQRKIQLINDVTSAIFFFVFWS